MIYPGRYGVALTFRAPIVKADSTDLAATGDWTPASGDVKISKDGGNVANVTTLPSAVGGTGSVLWSWPLSATEMEATEVVLQVVDSATKAVVDQAFVVRNLPPGAVTTGKAQAGTASTIQLASGENFGADDRPIGFVVEIHGGTGLGQARVITDYVNATDTAGVEPDWTTTPDSSSYYTIWPGPQAPDVTLPPVHVGTIEDGAISSTTFGTGAISATAIADDAITAAKIATDAIAADGLAADAVTEIQSGLATAAALTTVDGKIDTIDSEVGDILVDTGTTLNDLLETVDGKVDTVDSNVDTLLTSDIIFKKNVAVTAFPFFMKLTDGSPGTGLTVAVEISKDGGAFTGLGGAIAEISDGWYEVDFAQAETNAKFIAFKATATGAEQRNLLIVTQD